MSQTWVYIITTCKNGRWVSPIKVGLAKDPHKRLQAVQTGSAYPLQVAAAFPLGVRELAVEIEASFHREMRDRALAGEWYDLTAFDATILLCHNVREHLEHLAEQCGGGDLDRALADANVLWHEEYIDRHSAIAQLSNVEPAGHG